MKVAILGAGKIARHMANAINGLDESIEAYAVGAREYEKAKEFAEKWGFQKAYGSYEEMLSDKEIDLVYVATPHSHHFEHAKLCLLHGKNVLVEKAFTANASMAKELFALADEKDLFITEAIWTRYMPSRQMILDIMNSGIIGKPVSIQANLCYSIEDVPRMQNPALAGGALLDLGIYPINFTSMVFGNDISSIQGLCEKYHTGVDAQETIWITYKDGRTASLFASMRCESDRIGVINGSNGYMEITNINNCEKISVYDNTHQLIEEHSVPKQINGYEYEVLACQKALSEGKTECMEMPHAETVLMLEWMDSLRKAWDIKYPFEK